jgi:hypothetical protein
VGNFLDVLQLYGEISPGIAVTYDRLHINISAGSVNACGEEAVSKSKYS